MVAVSGAHSAAFCWACLPQVQNYPTKDLQLTLITLPEPGLSSHGAVSIPLVVQGQMWHSQIQHACFSHGPALDHRRHSFIVNLDTLGKKG